MYRIQLNKIYLIIFCFFMLYCSKVIAQINPSELLEERALAIYSQGLYPNVSQAFTSFDDLSINISRSGENNILNNYFETPTYDYSLSFPSGDIIRKHSFITGIKYRPKPNLEIDVKFNYVNSNQSEDQKYISIIINGYIPYRYSF